MKTQNPIQFALLTAATLCTHAASAGKPPTPPPPPSSGTLVLSYPSSANWGLAASPSGTIYAVGNTYTTWSQLVLGTSDSGSSWSVLDDFAPPGRHVDFFGAFDLGGCIISDPAGNLYVSGLSYPDEFSNAYAQWYVRRSTDSGATWSNVDTFQLASSKSAVALGIGENASGIYVVGHAYNVNGRVNSSHWMVRKSTNGGNSWTTVDDYQLVADNSSQARCIAADANGNLVVAGSGAGKWIVRKSAGGTGPWTMVDVFQNGGAVTTPNAIAADAFGNVLAGGNDGANWLIKKY